MTRTEPLILVVEDTPRWLERYCRVLAGAGYHSVGAESVQRALGLMRQRAVDLVLQDLGLPTSSGLGDSIHNGLFLLLGATVVTAAGVALGIGGRELSLDGSEVLAPNGMCTLTPDQNGTGSRCQVYDSARLGIALVTVGAAAAAGGLILMLVPGSRRWVARPSPLSTTTGMALAGGAP